MSGPRLRFCRESNDLLYPREDKERKRLVYYCKNCDYVEDADEADWCVYRNAVKDVKEKTVITQVRPRLQRAPGQGGAEVASGGFEYRQH